MNQKDESLLSADRILLAHGSGGELSHKLVESVFVKAFDNPLLAPLDDAAVLGIAGSRLAFTTDSYVVTPLFFPGGGHRKTGCVRYGQ